MFAPVPIPDQFAVSIGEMLWDSIGDTRHVGGAPLNFAYHCRAMGVRSALISAVSNDDLGAELLTRAKALGIDTSSVHHHSSCETGMVVAESKPDGSVTYSFPAECPWDHIQFDDQARDLIDQAHIVNFGTLAQRSTGSRAAVMAALSSVNDRTLRFLDLNLRVPYVDRDTIHRSLEMADVVKLNTWELAELKSLLHLAGNEEFAMAALLEKYELQAIVVTRGADGAYGLGHNQSAQVSGIKLDVVDTVGCGDAFSAALAIQLRAGASLQDALETANAAGAFVASHAGATPAYTPADIIRFRDEHPRPIRESMSVS